MKDFIVSMEATCDILPEDETKYGFKIVPMNFLVGEEFYSTKNDDVVSSAIYQRMKEGKKTSTSQVNESGYEAFFVDLMKTNKPILHIAFSSGLSGSYNVAKTVIEKLNQIYEPKIYLVDSLGGCQGQVILGILAQVFSKSANNVQEIVDFVENIKLRVIHKFSVDNLKYLANGGRISGASALVGNLLSIKPLIKVNDDGKLASYMKVISRKKALKVLVSQFKEEVDKNYDFCFVSHSDCEGDALFVKNLIETETNFKPVISNIGPVLGCHCGPGTIALFYVGRNR